MKNILSDALVSRSLFLSVLSISILMQAENVQLATIPQKPQFALIQEKLKKAFNDISIITTALVYPKGSRLRRKFKEMQSNDELFKALSLLPQEKQIAFYKVLKNTQQDAKLLLASIGTYFSTVPLKIKELANPETPLLKSETEALVGKPELISAMQKLQNAFTTLVPWMQGNGNYSQSAPGTNRHTVGLISAPKIKTAKTDDELFSEISLLAVAAQVPFYEKLEAMKKDAQLLIISIDEYRAKVPYSIRNGL